MCFQAERCSNAGRRQSVGGRLWCKVKSEVCPHQRWCGQEGRYVQTDGKEYCIEYLQTVPQVEVVADQSEEEQSVTEDESEAAAEEETVSKKWFKSNKK